MSTTEKSRVSEWVQLGEQWCEPGWVHWCDGSPRDLFVIPYLRTGDEPALMVTDRAAHSAELYRNARVGGEALTEIGMGG